MGMFFGDNEDDIARRKALNSDKSLFFSESDDDIARRKALNSDNGKFKTVILECIDKGTADDINRYISGNYFKTPEIAEEVLNSDVWKNRFLNFRENKEIKREYRKAYYTISFEDGECFISTDLGSEDDNKNFQSGNYFKTYEEISSFLENGLLNSQNQIKEFTKKLEMKLKIEDDNFTNNEKYKKFKKVNNTSYWRANINEVYFTIENNLIKAENENSIDISKNNEDYRTGNYFKTYGIAKEVLNSDIWKNRFWDYRKNKEKKDELLEDEMYYSVDDDGVDFNPCLDFSDFLSLKSGNYFKTEKEALDFFENDYPKSIKRIKDFTNELMKKNGYEICGYDLIKK